ncbi:hypothetical protein COW99_03565 [Candidatus Roizmanbacteria bacterium CG22_combo_CG10-13_8_21_14_all_38_20]|uniref:Uncharacterized protein n=1 Tax=Candidatus Roizmanbacteria bacterium CG22_combo_CG10-13_8_21_14_all_38_20 TaxID=1974862 RepID=A0A2H0BV67_9BACT|nr:MAG: hypothetical protein COW99_03565 [Candidatus Roizmanbacteria bacterium CG22_combo_CG10-13_8_21_14_all_38_20]PJC31530.1 MAG: hypothetical protein CO050_03030 [Candidatus Roizmanbacteria bacterium CG_4_9_14_0_2_um_filter_38_17]
MFFWWEKVKVLKPGFKITMKDLYKGNGRLRHESHFIEQGPFQAISFDSYQSKEVNPKLKQGLNVRAL